MFRVNLSLAFEELLPASPLRIFSVADLEPLRRLLEVGSELVFRDDAFEISLAGECEQLFPGSLDVIAIGEPLAFLGQDGAERCLLSPSPEDSLLITMTFASDGSPLQWERTNYSFHERHSTLNFRSAQRR